MFYNVENLFDTIDDPWVNDADFLPEGRYKWTGERYLHKIEQLGRVISDDGEGVLPSIIGLCEVENRQVLEDLTGSHWLRDAGYSIVHYDSPDARGIDVALLYKPADFRVLFSYPLSVTLPWDLEFRTRDILYVEGVVGTDTLHIYVNHWSSRRGGVEASEPKRLQAANVLRKHLDSRAPHFKTFHVVIMGDLNDEPSDRSVKEVLKALPPGTECDGEIATCLINLSAFLPEEEGTYYFWRDKKWNTLDQIILSYSLITGYEYQKEGDVRWESGGFVVKRRPWMLKEQDGQMIPFRSYARDYEGGFSDHLPVRITLVVGNQFPKKTKRCRLRKKVREK